MVHSAVFVSIPDHCQQSPLSPSVHLDPQNAIVPFKELCGLSAVANLKQCILALCPRLMGTDGNPLLVFETSATSTPTWSPRVCPPEVLKKVVTTYEVVSNRRKGERWL